MKRICVAALIHAALLLSQRHLEIGVAEIVADEH